MEKTIYILFLYYGVLLQSAFAQSLQFWGEKIEITIHEEHAEVRGEYHFKNSSSHSVQRTLFYPFMIKEDLPYPDSISVMHDAESISFNRQNDGIGFSVTIPPESICVYEVFYSQKTPAQKMEYILTTTQRWQKPLSFAEYILKMPLNLQLKYLSLTNPEWEIKDNYKIYRIYKTNYMPTTNFMVEWARRK